MTVNVPKQDAPVVNVTAPVSVEMPHPTAMDQNVERDENGDILRTRTTYTLPPKKG